MGFIFLFANNDVLHFLGNLITSKISTQYFSRDLNYQFGDLSQQTWLIKFGHQRSLLVPLKHYLEQTSQKVIGVIIASRVLKEMFLEFNQSGADPMNHL